MTDFDARYGQSYPPSILGGTRPHPPASDPNKVNTAHATAAAFADLATLKADGTSGDGHYTGAAFTAGQYITLVDGSKTHYAAGVWAADAADEPADEPDEYADLDDDGDHDDDDHHLEDEDEDEEED